MDFRTKPSLEKRVAREMLSGYRKITLDRVTGVLMKFCQNTRRRTFHEQARV